MRVLVVDDSAVMRRIIINALAVAGVTDVVQAADGQEAVSSAASAEFDAILLDWNMPVLSGIEALKVIRGMGIKSPVLMVTTEAEKTRVMEALKAGANNYVIKPFDPATLGQKLLAAIGQKAPAAA
jgi:two-component system chemotaxis response regulator CheY